jgi:hypothetical protein
MLERSESPPVVFDRVEPAALEFQQPAVIGKPPQRIVEQHFQGVPGTGFEEL